MNKFIFILITAFLLLSCSSNPPEEPTPILPTQPLEPVVPQQQPMAFVSESSSASRASETPLQDTYDVFKVWAYKEKGGSGSGLGSGTSSETVMPGYQVKYLNDIDHWQYDGGKYTSVVEFINPVEGHDRQYLKYWDGSAQSYSFNAFAPVTWPYLTCDENGFTISNLNGHTSSVSGTEVLIAQHRRDMTGTLKDIDLLDQAHSFPVLNNYYDAVPLRFHHLFSRVTFKIYNVGDTPIKLWRGSVKLTDDYQFITTANYINDHLEANGGAVAKSSTLTAFEFQSPKILEANMTAEDAQVLTTMYELSQVLTPLTTDNIYITITVNNTIVQGTYTLPNGKWDCDKDYIYYIKVSVGEGSPILIDLTLDEFDFGDEIEEEQTNW